MGFFSGPSRDVLLKTAMGIASYAMQLRILERLDSTAKEQGLSQIAAGGGPTCLDELIVMAARIVQENDMGWYKRNQFLGMIGGSLVSVGMATPDAQLIVQEVERLCSLSASRVRREPVVSTAEFGRGKAPASQAAVRPAAHASAHHVLPDSVKWTSIGGSIANDCLENGLREGGIVRYSEIAEYIASRHQHHSSAVQYGFTSRMQQFVESGEIVIAKVEGDEIVFVHEKHADELLPPSAPGASLFDELCVAVTSVRGPDLVKVSLALARDYGFFLDCEVGAKECFCAVYGHLAHLAMGASKCSATSEEYTKRYMEVLRNSDFMPVMKSLCPSWRTFASPLADMAWRLRDQMSDPEQFSKVCIGAAISKLGPELFQISDQGGVSTPS